MLAPHCSSDRRKSGHAPDSAPEHFVLRTEQAARKTNVLFTPGTIKVGFEIFWLDAYWTRDGFLAGMGHYGFPIQRAEPQDRFPRGLRSDRDAVRNQGMGFLMWFEPERVHPAPLSQTSTPSGSSLRAKDNDGLLTWEFRSQGIQTRYLKTVIQQYGLACLRIDYNIDPLPFWEFLNNKAPDRVGMAEIRYVEGCIKCGMTS